MRANKLLTGILVGVVLGMILGGWFPEFGTRLKPLGDLFLNALMMIVIPLIISSMIVGITGLGDIRKLGRMGWQTLVYYLVTTSVSVVIGIALVNLIKPGVGMAMGAPEALKPSEYSIGQLISELVPRNLFKAMAEMRVLPLIVFSLLFGGVLSTIGDKGKPVIQLFDGVNEALMKLVHLIMYFAPVGVLGLIASRIGGAGGWSGFWPELQRVMSYSMTVLLGLFIHGAIILPLILRLAGGRRAFGFVSNMAPALLTAFSTASSSATLPVTMECVEEKNRVSSKVASFVLPLGATVNMDGTALYEAVAAVFIAQIYGIHLSPAQQVVVFLTATLASIGAAGIPQAGLVTMVMVLKAVNLPVEGIGAILAVDWLLDRFRTTVNVWGDSIGSAVVERISRVE
jgi:Na+/H+-dicarboxylate symporter